MKHITSFNIRRKIVALAVAFCTIFTMFSTSSAVFAAEAPADNQAIQNEENQPVIVIQRIGDVDEADAASISTTSSTTTYLDVRGSLAPGGTKSGTFTLTKWFGTDFSVIACASNTGGSINISFVSAAYTVPCDGVARVLARETGWGRGTYSYSIYNGTSNTIAYELGVFEFN